MHRPPHILPVIILSQFAGTSLWFAGNAVIPDLQLAWGLETPNTGHITSAVQFGFITGTLFFAFFAVSDRLSSPRVFLSCSLAGAISNLSVLFIPEQLTWLLASRFATGFFLAGIYPVGMKIAAGWYEQGLGRALGYLVGALVLGTAFPHLLRGLGTGLPWQDVMIAISVLAAAGGLAVLFLVPDGPNTARGTRFDPRAFAKIFRSPHYRASAFGYFGHMWELYTFWAFIPMWLMAYNERAETSIDPSLWAFLIIAVGVAGCVGGGLISRTAGSARVAVAQLMVSGICCVLSVVFFHLDSWMLLAFLLVWGVAVIGDSPQFSALNAKHAPKEYVGSALTIANCIGFFLSILSIQLAELLLPFTGPEFIFWVLVPGPLFGLWSMRLLTARSREQA